MKQLLILIFFLDLIANLSYLQGSTEIVQNNLNFSFMNAAADGDIESTKAFLIEGADINAVDNRSWSALMFAVNNNRIDVVEFLLLEGADVNMVNNRGWSALMLSVFFHRLNITELLLEAGANLNVVENDNGWTALMWAVRSNDRDIVELLLKAGADINVVGRVINIFNNNFMTAINLANNNPEIMDLLLSYRAFRLLPIMGLFDQEPKPEDYITETVIAKGASGEEFLDVLEQNDEQLEQQIRAFEQDHIAYWWNKIKAAYIKFLNIDFQPLRTLFTQEIYEKIGLLPEIVSLFSSRVDFIWVLEKLQQGATPQETEKLQKVIDLLVNLES